MNEIRHIFPFLIPIVAIVMGVGIGMLALWLDFQRKRELFELHHKERLAAIERGMEVPPLPAEFFQSRREQRWSLPGGSVHAGLVWLLVGLAVMTALALNISLEAATWGLIPVAVGLANLIHAAIIGRQAGSPRQQPPASDAG